MRELTIPSAGAPPQNSAAQYVFDNARTRPDLVSLKVRGSDGWSDVTAAQFAEQVRGVAKGLIAARHPRPATASRCMGKTRYEWTLFDFAIWAAGAVVVPIYETSSADQVEWILSDSGAESRRRRERRARRARRVGARADAPTSRQVWQIDDDAVDALTAAGADVGRRRCTPGRRPRKPDDLATLIYTSGTTGRPKGCELTHGNFLFEVGELASGLRQTCSTPTARRCCSCRSRTCSRGSSRSARIATGCTLGHTADVKNLVDDLGGLPADVRARRAPGVREGLQRRQAEGRTPTARARSSTGPRRSAIDVLRGAGHRRRRPGAASCSTRCSTSWSTASCAPRSAAAASRAISGGAPLGDRLGHFFRGIGVTVYEGYGLTETTAGAPSTTTDAIKIGTVGRPLPGIDASGSPTTARSCLRGGDRLPRLLEERRRPPPRRIDADGWFHTGDLGELDDDGFLQDHRAQEGDHRHRRRQERRARRCSRTASAPTRWSASASSSATSSRSSPR